MSEGAPRGFRAADFVWLKMISPSKEKILTWGLPIAMACVLIILAVMQYRWSREVSEAARNRMQANLQMSLMNLRQDFARELAAMCLDMQSDAASSSAEAKGLSEKLQRWQQTASHPGLVASVYLWDVSSHNSLLRLSPAGARFETNPWPKNLAELHRFLSSDFMREPAPRQRRITPRPQGEDRPPSAGRVEFPPPAAIDQSVPALIVPATRGPTPHENGLASSWLIVELDSGVLRDRVFPDLVERYFGEPKSSDYEVAVVGGSLEQPQVLYSSLPGFGSDAAERGDGSLNLFGPPASRVEHQAGSDFFRFMPAPGAGGPWSPSRNPFSDMFGAMRFDPLHSHPGARDWRVVVRSRKGSVEAAAEELRRRNLATSFGVLLILAATMGLILFTSQRARRLATLQMDFVAGVSHELRTPLAGILSAAENIADGVVDNKEQLVRYGGIIKNQATQLKNLVEQVLSFASVQRNKTPASNLRTLQVRDAIEDVLENTTSTVQASGITVDLRIDPNLPALVADPEAFSQCLQNLITNAIKYSGESKWMGIRAGQAGGEVTITVEDHGIGISSEEMKQIFEPFYRSPAVAGSQVHGTGLGLALARSFAESMGGRITVQSEVGKGSAFSVHLPAATQPRGENAPIEISAGHKLS